MLQKADALRDAGMVASAAGAYAAILVQAPWRTDVRVQYGNMLKDSGRPDLAETAYRQAMAESPEDPDISLQLGHALKMMGRRPASLAAYESAAALGSAQAVIELARSGRPGQQHLLFDAQMRAGGIEALLRVQGELAGLRSLLDKTMSALADAGTWTSFPIGLYGEFRRLFDVPAPDPGRRPASTYAYADREQLDACCCCGEAGRCSSNPMGRGASWPLGRTRIAGRRSAAPRRPIPASLGKTRSQLPITR